LLSESQERMLFIVKNGHEQEVANIFNKWDIESEIIGIVENKPDITIRLNNEVVANLPADPLVLGGGAPIYIREARVPKYLDRCRKHDLSSLPIPKDMNKTFIELLARPSIASKRWVYEQYDSMVRTNSVRLSDSDAAVIRLKGTNKALALKTDCNARFVYLNPRRGTQIAVAEAARNVACVGAKPIAITNCLNFGNPYDPEIYWQFVEAIAGMREACIAFSTPVTGGNVSFYNEGPSGAIIPTPVIGMLGLLDDVDKAINSKFKATGDIIIELGINQGEVGGSEYLAMRQNEILGDAPSIDLEYEARLHKICQTFAIQGLAKSIHDVSDGGMAVTLVESLSGSGELGCQIEINSLSKIRHDFLLFGESQSRVIVSCKPEKLTGILMEAKRFAIDAKQIGIVTKKRQLQIGKIIDLSVEEVLNAYNNSIELKMPIEEE
jgi:phosphoribosylformylglycinamidine synthase subunit PurL